MALAVFTGSLGSGGGGLRAVLTEQNLQPRVHVSPKTCDKKHKDKSSMKYQPQTNKHSMFLQT